jgi:two-component system nitrate/nitrite response regulator NarL
MEAYATKQPIRVLTADTHPLFGDALARSIRQRAVFQLVAEASDGPEALSAIARLVPDVAVLHVQPPTLDARAVLRAVCRRGLTTRALLLGEADRPDEAYEALAEGAAGWITPAATAEQLCAAVLSVARGDGHICRELHRGLTREIGLRWGANRTLLSAREQEILELIADGHHGPRIARELHIALGTVRTHVAHLYDKLGVADRAAAVAEGMRRGLLD